MLLPPAGCAAQAGRGRRELQDRRTRHCLRRTQRHPAGGAEHLRVRHQDPRTRRAQALHRRSHRTRRSRGAVSQMMRKMIETLFGDGKQHGGTIRQVKLRVRFKVSAVFTLAMLAVNLRPLRGLLVAQATWPGADGRERFIHLHDSTGNSGKSGAIESANARQSPRCARFTRKTPSRSIWPVQIADNFDELLRASAIS